MEFFTLFCNKICHFFQNPETLHLFASNRFLLIFLVICLTHIKQSTYSSLWLCALINIPGTFLHETLHFLTGFILNSRPSGYSIFPKRSSGGYTLGNVSHKHITFYNALPTALAPLLLLVVGFYFNRWYFANVHISYLNYIGYILLQTIFIENAIPSKTDFKVALSYPLGLVLYGLIFFFAVVLFI